MRKLLITSVVLLLAQAGYAQQLNQVKFTYNGSLSSIALITDQDVLIRISDDGKILEWGFEVMSQRYNYYAPQLQPYMGRIDYYGPETDSVFRGKVKSIGTCMFTYYGAYEKKEKIGKLKSIGNQALDYFSDYDNVALQGKINSIGYTRLDYYSSYENEAIKGKLKVIGNTTISYYTTFDDKLIRGKIKSIGSYNYQWYTSFDHPEYGGGLKSGSLRQNVNGVNFLLQ